VSFDPKFELADILLTGWPVVKGTPESGIVQCKMSMKLANWLEQFPIGDNPLTSCLAQGVHFTLGVDALMDQQRRVRVTEVVEAQAR